MSNLNNNQDPNGLAAVIIGGLTPTILALGLVLGWGTELSTAVTTAVAALVNTVVSVIVIWQARKHAYAPATVERIRQVDARVLPAQNG